MNTLRIAGIAIRELIHERFFYILIVFAALALALSLVFGQMTYAEAAKLTLDFLLAATELSMVLFSVFVGISLFQKELTLGSVSMVLSKPISRGSFLLGKFLGQITVQLFVIAAMITMTYFLSHSAQELVTSVSAVSLAQTGLLIFMEALVLTGITYFFAVNSNASTTAIASLCLFWLGHFRSSAKESMGAASDTLPWQLTKTIVPDLSVFNMKALASYGLSIPWSEVGWAAVYAGCCLAFYLSLATLTFARKDILT